MRIKEAIAKLHDREKSMILRQMEKEKQSFSVLADGGLPEKVGKETRAQTGSKGRFCASKSFAIASKFLIFSLIIPCLLCADCEPICKRPGLLSLGVGTFDTLRPKERMLQFQAEYKWSACWKGIQPIACLMFSEKGSVYFCFGACYDIYFKKYFILTPSFAPGVYFKNGGKELGFPLEFRSSIALAGEFRNCHRLGLQFYHISNASLGFKNPGEESLVVFYSIAIW